MESDTIIKVKNAQAKVTRGITELNKLLKELGETENTKNVRNILKIRARLNEDRQELCKLRNEQIKNLDAKITKFTQVHVKASLDSAVERGKKESGKNPDNGTSKIKLEETTGVQLLEMMVTLVESSLWEDAVEVQFEFNNQLEFTLATPTVVQPGNGIINFEHITHTRWREDLQHDMKKDFSAKFIRFCDEGYKIKDTTCTTRAACVLVMFEIARRKWNENYPVTRNEIIDGISKSIAMWNISPADESAREMIDMFAPSDEVQKQYKNEVISGQDVLKKRQVAYKRIVRKFDRLSVDDVTNSMQQLSMSPTH